MAKNKFLSWLGIDKKDTPAENTKESEAQAQQTREDEVPADTNARSLEQPISDQPNSDQPNSEQSAQISAEQAGADNTLQDQQLDVAQTANVEAEQVTIDQDAIVQDTIEQDTIVQDLNTHDNDVTSNIEAAQPVPQEDVSERQDTEQSNQSKVGFFSRLKQGLQKTKQNIGAGFASIFTGKKIDDDLFEELETQLLTADVGVDTTLKLIDRLTEGANRKQLKDGEALYSLLKEEMSQMLVNADKPLVIENSDGPFVILMVGVNGVGKTTTIGKLAKQFQAQGKSVMLAAGDTFRAAAVEQLQVWGERNDIPVIAQHTGADSASVIFDALQAAKARGVDVLIADTAGRLQNKDNLMQELEKIARVMKKLDVNAPHEVMLTIDAGTGQNAISQVKLFDQVVGLTGISLTKLDGTAKGGVIFAIADQFETPIRYIGVGEGIDDLRAFNSADFIEALFSET
jgi:fused signal recognition particle receptor